MKTESTDRYKILVPIDGSPLGDQAIAYAASFALPGDEVQLLHVATFPTPPHDLRGVNHQLTDQEIEQYEEQARRVTQSAAEIWHALIPHPTHLLAFGDPAEEIVAAAARARADLVVMATHARGTVGRWRHGSVMDRVVRQSPAPVLVVRPRDVTEGFGAAPVFRFVAPIDGSELSAQALPVVKALAKRLHRPVRLLTVAVPAPVLAGRIGAIQADAVAHDAAATVEYEAERRLAAAADEFAAEGIPVSWELDAGDPFARIDAQVKAGEVIVMASHGRTGFDRFALGSVADKLIREADAPVIVVHPTHG